MKSIKKKTGANFLFLAMHCGKILLYILIFIYFFKYETIVRFDVYACLDCNCWKCIIVHYCKPPSPGFKKLSTPLKGMKNMAHVLWRSSLSYPNQHLQKSAFTFSKEEDPKLYYFSVSVEKRRPPFFAKFTVLHRSCTMDIK